MSQDPSLARLREIKHIVVLMMENRSFDQMLGYLMRDGLPEVNGLTGRESNPDNDGVEHQVFEWGLDQTAFHPPQDRTGKILDPCHSVQCVAEQLADGNGGFVKNFIATREDADGKPVTIPAEYRALPMGYYAAEHLPAYDFLARHYCVCDAWHASVPGDTWPNRLFAMTGGQAPPAKLSLVERARELLHDPKLLANAPIYDGHAFTRQLADSQWRWYSHDPATLRAADDLYRTFRGLDRDNFAYFNRQRMSILTRALESPIVGPDSFLDDAATGQLREVSWIDPNFIDLTVMDPNSNDDHPPSDIRAGQALVLDVYHALRNSPAWEDTVLVVVYDEHGGFYDHVAPPRLDVDDGSGFHSYGVRVPALIIGPRVGRQVCHQSFDHTTLIKTILLRFASDPQSAIAAMGARVEHAPHLGVVLEDAPRTDVPPADDPQQRIDAWRVQARAARVVSSPGADGATVLDGAGAPFELHDFQRDFARFKLTMHALGLPYGEP